MPKCVNPTCTNIVPAHDLPRWKGACCPSCYHAWRNVKQHAAIAQTIIAPRINPRHGRDNRD